MFIRNINKNIAFGTYYYTKSKDNSRDVEYRNDTMLFRSDIDWNVLSDCITQDKTPKKIYCYACSDGSEAYSLVIALIAKLGYENAKQYFPIVARDIDEKVISMARSGYLQIEKADSYKLSRYQNQTGLQYLRFVKNMGKGVVKCKVSPFLTENIIFEKGDLLKDIDFLDMDNAVLMFRNVWPYLPFLHEFELIEKLSEKINGNSMLVIGDYDKSSLCCNSIQRNILIDYGFTEVKPLIFRKRKPISQMFYN